MKVACVLSMRFIDDLYTFADFVRLEGGLRDLFRQSSSLSRIVNQKF
jgi:hypothetical protein